LSVFVALILRIKAVKRNSCKEEVMENDTKNEKTPFATGIAAGVLKRARYRERTH
jgi:hypothetical protein